MKFARVALATATLIAIPVFAATPVINQHQANQQKRIAKGAASGQLTGNETVKLEKGQARVANMKSAAKVDGKVSNAERAEIRQAQKVQNKKIRELKHN